jgi:hypothetical protein
MKDGGTKEYFRIKDQREISTSLSHEIYDDTSYKFCTVITQYMPL